MKCSWRRVLGASRVVHAEQAWPINKAKNDMYILRFTMLFCFGTVGKTMEKIKFSHVYMKLVFQCMCTEKQLPT
jgi:hypothetical protein